MERIPFGIDRLDSTIGGGPARVPGSSSTQQRR